MIITKNNENGFMTKTCTSGNLRRLYNFQHDWINCAQKGCRVGEKIISVYL